ncbi:MAG: hypothetical protein HC799_00800 [Limnothrix sp. RL_2_0]|nr:hypothetical protein [Limnothrix sp. RL_2_0]
MSDQVVKTETTGYFERLRNSIMGIFLGLLLFLASFGVLYWNEGRVDLSRVAKTSVEVAATGVPSADSGEFVSVTGNLDSPDTLGDRPFLVEGEYVALRRISEMYAWAERSSTETQKNTGGSETKTTTYTYEKTWTERPDNSSSFQKPQGHTNPTKSIESDEFQVAKATVGDYQLDMPKIGLPGLDKLSLTPTNVLPEYKSQQMGEYIFIGKGSIATPEIGDLRISYRALGQGVEATAFGALGAQQLSPYQARKKISFYRLFTGTREQAIASLASEHKIMTWGLRAGGFVMMWIGLNLVIEPLGVLLDFFPFIGNLARTASGFATFIIAAVLSSVTIVISIILHNPIMLFLAAGLSGFIIYRLTKGKKSKPVEDAG